MVPDFFPIFIQNCPSRSCKRFKDILPFKTIIQKYLRFIIMGTTVTSNSWWSLEVSYGALQSVKVVFWNLSFFYISVKLHFRNWVFFCLQVKKKGKDRTLDVGPPGCASLWPGLPFLGPGTPTLNLSRSEASSPWGPNI